MISRDPLIGGLTIGPGKEVHRRAWCEPHPRTRRRDGREAGRPGDSYHYVMGPERMVDQSNRHVAAIGPKVPQVATRYRHSAGRPSIGRHDLATIMITIFHDHLWASSPAGWPAAPGGKGRGWYLRSTAVRGRLAECRGRVVATSWMRSSHAGAWPASRRLLRSCGRRRWPAPAAVGVEEARSPCPKRLTRAQLRSADFASEGGRQPWLAGRPRNLSVSSEDLSAKVRCCSTTAL